MNIGNVNAQDKLKSIESKYDFFNLQVSNESLATPKGLKISPKGVI